MKMYVNRIGLRKFSGHLEYSTSENAMIFFFDRTICSTIKRRQARSFINIHMENPNKKMALHERILKIIFFEKKTHRSGKMSVIYIRLQILTNLGLINNTAT